MTPGSLLPRLDSLIEAGRSFAAWRLPGSRTIRLALQEKGSPTLSGRMESLNGKRGFVIAPFEVSPACPVVLIRPGREEIIPAPETQVFAPAARLAPPVRMNTAYAGRFDTFIAPIREKRFRKLVLSREETVARPEGFSPGGAFLLSCAGHPRSCVYLLHTPETGAWLGSTPEMLLSGGRGVWKTVALAGTQLLASGGLPERWDDKNLIEQMLVACYVREQLLSFGIRPEESAPCTVHAGGLAHLRTDFRFTMPGSNRTGDLLKLLHPTPAVSGLPKEEAFRFILANEGYSRRYYSGFTGWLDPAGESDLYVNLRCMNILPGSLRLYAGGGLLPSSVAETEWQETEHKLQTMRFAIANTFIELTQ
jgi:isochorismate synthase